MDVPMAHWVLESRTGRPHEPYANRTPLGWVLFGPIRPRTKNSYRKPYFSTSQKHLIGSHTSAAPQTPVLRDSRNNPSPDQGVLIRQIIPSENRLDRLLFSASLHWSYSRLRLGTNPVSD
ncbi:hypothetical protein T265_03807 [Opisthorchis viverrini]|uniref:Uncharacterized protein n=1 Tax=Opisthorchis viverrini TaxID=6198 RepID=A0A074ZUT4_OPIVI|nr:hypothetical protein T265_03807 [Opisthorchis viverrini]KER29607.1 hypothetical protein T265_03807 [Opisthorchis viverrini]